MQTASSTPSRASALSQIPPTPSPREAEPKAVIDTFHGGAIGGLAAMTAPIFLGFQALQATARVVTASVLPAFDHLDSRRITDNVMLAVKAGLGAVATTLLLPVSVPLASLAGAVYHKYLLTPSSEHPYYR